MGDRRAEARRRGLVPRAPAYSGAWVVLGGLIGTAIGAARAPWGALAAAAWGGQRGPVDLAPALAVMAPLAGLTAFGAILGLVIGQLTLGAWAPALRRRWRPPPAPRRLAPAFLAAALGALAVLPWALTRAGPDPGRLLLWTPAAALIAGALAMLPLVLLERARARRRWHRQVEPWPPPRREPGELAPEIRAAVRARARGDEGGA